MARFFIHCPAGQITKAKANARMEGAPTVRLLASGTQRDLTNDKVAPALLDSMLAQAKAGTVKLLESHSATFPMGYSFDGEIKEAPNGARELFVDFWLDTAHPMTAAALRQLDAGYEAQCSIGVNENPQTEVRNDTDGPARILLAGNFDHVAFTRPNEAAYQFADVVHVFKSLDEATAQQGKGFSAMNEKMEANKAARAALCEKMKAPGFAKDDMMTACKTAAEHCKAIGDMAGMMAGDTAASADDLRATLNDLHAEVEMLETALASHIAAPASEAHQTEEAAKAAPADAPAAAEKPVAEKPEPEAALAKEAAPADDTPKVPPPGLGPAVETVPAVAGEDKPKPAMEVKDDIMNEMKAMKAALEEATKVNKSLNDRLVKVEGMPDYRNAPARYLTKGEADTTGPEAIMKGLSPRDRDTLSRAAAATALENILRKPRG